MTLNFNAAFQTDYAQPTGKKNVAIAPGGEAFLAAMEELINEEHKRTVTVGGANEQSGAAMQKNKFMIEDGKNLKFPMDEDILQELLETVKSKIKQLKQLRENLDLN